MRVVRVPDAPEDPEAPEAADPLQGRMMGICRYVGLSGLPGQVELAALAGLVGGDVRGRPGESLGVRGGLAGLKLAHVPFRRLLWPLRLLRLLRLAGLVAKAVGRTVGSAVGSADSPSKPKG